MRLDSTSHTPWRVLVVAVLLVGLGLPGPARGAAVAALEAPCCGGQVASSMAEGSAEARGADDGVEQVRSGFRHGCSCSIRACQHCSGLDALHPRQRVDSLSYEIDGVGDLAVGYPGQRANPPRALAEPLATPPVASPPERLLYLDHQVLLI